MAASTDLSASNTKISAAFTTFSTDYSKSQPTTKLHADLQAVTSAIDADKDLTASQRATLSSDANDLATALTSQPNMSDAMQKFASDFADFAGGPNALVHLASVSPNVPSGGTASSAGADGGGGANPMQDNSPMDSYTNGTAGVKITPNSDGTATLSAAPGTGIKFTGYAAVSSFNQVRMPGFDITANGKTTYMPMPKGTTLVSYNNSKGEFVLGGTGQNAQLQKRNPLAVLGLVGAGLAAAGYYLYNKPGAGTGAETPFGISGAPDPQDVSQGNMGDCWYLSALASVADTDPQLISNNVHQNHDGTYDVTLYDTAHQPATPVHYNSISIPSNWRGIGNPQGASTLNPINGAPAQWVAAYELAALQFAQHPPTPGHNYNIRPDMEGGNPDAAYAMITGRTQSRTDLSHSSNQDQVWNDLVAANGPGSSPAGHDTPIEANANLNPGNGLNALHTYSVVGALLVGGARMVVLHDPWGGPNAKQTISLAAFMSAFSAYFH